jgi:hypothetical protein
VKNNSCPPKRNTEENASNAIHGDKTLPIYPQPLKDGEEILPLFEQWREKKLMKKNNYMVNYAEVADPEVRGGNF